jgi:hypothetical protein
MPKINPVVIGVAAAGGLAIALLASKSKPKISQQQMDDAAASAAAKAVADAQAKKEAAAKAAEQAAIAKKADAVVTNVAPEKLPSTAIYGQLHVGVIPKAGVSTDDVTAAIDKLTADKFGIPKLGVTPKAITYTKTAAGSTLIQKSWDLHILPVNVPIVVARAHAALDPLGANKPSIAFASSTLNAAA